MILALPNNSWVGCAMCLLIAVLVGAYRQWCIYFWERIELLPIADDGDNKSEDFHLNAYVPGWKSNKFRIGSWLLVAACSTLGAAWGTVLLRGFNFEHRIIYFLGILLTRWLLSALLGMSVANHTLRGGHSVPQ
ncbi:MAG: hypothetical protein ABSF71_31190 [Terriglobia bacterium]|jgi:hypothetical protein